MNRSIQPNLNDDAMALAFAAGELTDDESADLRRRMEIDASLDRRVRRAERDYLAVMEQLDLLEEQSGPVNDASALRQVDRLLDEWQTQRFMRRLPAPMERHWRIPRWAYSAAAVVALLVGFCFWWANNSPPDTTAMGPSISAAVDQPSSQDQAQPLSLEQMPLAFRDTTDDQMDDLSNMEQEMLAISQENFSSNNPSNGISQ